MAETDIETSGGAPDDRAPSALVGEIERTRADLARTIDEITDRVTPANVVRRTTDASEHAEYVWRFCWGGLGHGRQ